MNNEYDNENFFQEYAKMPRSKDGLCSAGEWHQLKPLFPSLQEKNVLDLGCGYGWHCKFAAEQGAVPKYWPVDNYFIPGERYTHFLGCDVTKQHHTLTQILMGLLHNGFELKAVEEAEPPQEMMDIPGMKDELRRRMMLLVKAIARKTVQMHIR